jgi:NAD(P)-dependent dehydrogenase (short-subunit alcohol dehydrogenase family)
MRLENKVALITGGYGGIGASLGTAVRPRGRDRLHGRPQRRTWRRAGQKVNESSYITGTDIVVDGGWFSSAPYLGNERSHHMLSLLDKKEQLGEFLQHFR